MERVEGGVDIHQGGQRRSFLIVALQPLQCLFFVPQPRIHLRDREFSDLSVISLVSPLNFTPESIPALSHKCLPQGNLIRRSGLHNRLVAFDPSLGQRRNGIGMNPNSGQPFNC